MYYATGIIGTISYSFAAIVSTYFAKDSRSWLIVSANS